MLLVIQVIISAIIFMILHVGIMALCAKNLGITLREVSFGLGPKLLSRNLINFRLIPFGGFVKMKDCRAEELSDYEALDAFDHQPLLKQLVVILSGPFTLLLLGLAILGGPGWGEFLSAFGQILLGSFKPLSVAQEYLEKFSQIATNNSFFYVFAFLSLKLSAYNLLPFSTTNGGQALILLAKGGRREVTWEQKLLFWLFWPSLIVFLSWSLAIIIYLYRVAT